MTRHVAPGNAPEIKAQKFDIKMPDFKIFDEMGDAKIKAANQNFKLYAETVVKTESEKMYQQFKNDPIQLSNALGKVHDMLKGIPEDIQDEMNHKLYLNSIALVQKAQNNQLALQDQQNKELGATSAERSKQLLSETFQNMLVNTTVAPEEKNMVMNDIFLEQRMHLNELAELKDHNGKYLYSEKQREQLTDPTDALLIGFKQFIYRPELDQLQEWDSNVFQNRDQFMRDMGISEKTYESMEKMLKERMKALKDTKTREIHGQAYYDATNLITEPIQTNIDKAKADGIIPKKTIDKIVSASIEATKTKYAFDPARKTSPGAFMRAISDFATTINNEDWSPEGRETAISQAADSIVHMSALAKEANMSPELVDTVLAAIKTTLVNKQAAQALDLTSAQFKNNIYNYSGNVDYAKIGESVLTSSTVDKAKALATQNFSENMLGAMNNYIMGDIDGYKQKVMEADRQFKIDSISFMPFSQNQWIQWQKDVENGKDVVLEYMGNTYRFNGFDAQEPLTLLNLT